ncbi:MAG: hypothetical protein AAF560_12865 [Acidobacteriota bacterium]
MNFIFARARFALLFLIPCAVSLAQVPVPLGPAFPINSTIDQSQAEPDVATDFDGALIAVWTSADQDGSGTGVYGQLFDELGNSLGPEIRINSTVEGDQREPAVSMTDDELFAVVWAGSDDDGAGIFLRVFGEKGATTKEDIQVNSTTEGMQSEPDVALAEDSAIMVVWQSSDGDGQGIRGRLFDTDGQPLTEELMISMTTMGDQLGPVVDDVDEDGTFIVVWEGPDSDGQGIYARAIDDTGKLLGSEILVNTTELGEQIEPALAVRTNDSDLIDNGFAITWLGPDGDGDGTFVRFFNEDGMPVLGEIRVNPLALGIQDDASVSIDDDGNFIVSWTEPDPNAVLDGDGSAELLGSPILIRGRRFGGGGSFGPELGVGIGEAFTIASGLLDRPVLALEANGDFACVWQNADDGSGSGVFGRRYGIGLFVDGFETGDTSGWSGTVP